MNALMIVYRKNPARVENYHRLAELLPGLEQFPACDALNDYDAIRDRAIESSWVDRDAYFDRWEMRHHPAKLGVDCSHISVLERVREADGWCLVLEDDVAWSGETDAWGQLERIAAEADQAGVSHVHLIPYPGKPSRDVFRPENRVSNNLWRGLPWWSTAAYLLTPQHARQLLGWLPLTDNIDRWYYQQACARPAHGFATHAAIFSHRGALHYKHQDSALGSIIWSNREDGKI